jgi:hypothetical protein
MRSLEVCSHPLKYREIHLRVAGNHMVLERGHQRIEGSYVLVPHDLDHRFGLDSANGFAAKNQKKRRDPNQDDNQSAPDRPSAQPKIGNHCFDSLDDYRLNREEEPELGAPGSRTLPDRSGIK